MMTWPCLVQQYKQPSHFVWGDLKGFICNNVQAELRRGKVNLANAFDPIDARIKNNIIGHLAPAGQRY